MAMARPRPRDAPVTRAVRPSSRPATGSSWVSGEPRVPHEGTQLCRKRSMRARSARVKVRRLHRGCGAQLLRLGRNGFAGARLEDARLAGAPALQLGREELDVLALFGRELPVQLRLRRARGAGRVPSGEE